MSNSRVAGRHGHRADSPSEIPPRGWKDIVLRVKDELGKDHLTVVAAGIAFYFFLALFPAMTAMVSLYGLVTEPAQVEQQLSQLTAILPQQAHELVSDILRQIAEKPDQALGFSLLVSILFSLWSANKGMRAVFEGVNITYHEDDGRSFLHKLAITLLFTLGAIVVLILCMALVIGFPAVVGRLGLPGFVQTLAQIARWVVLAAVIVLSLGLIYKVAPARDDPEFKWVSWGAVIATALWILGSLLFSWYVTNFGSFDKTYGSFAAVIILMLWFFLTAFVILLGAEINSEMEHQTRRDTTVGEEQPMGQRDAYYADRVAGED